MAELIGCRPNLLWLLIQDPALALRCFFGPCVPAQWRLMGPGAWSGAKKVIEDAPENVFYATRKRNKKNQENRAATVVWKLLLLVTVVLVVILAAAWMR